MEKAGPNKNYESGQDPDLVNYLVRCGLINENEINTRKGQMIIHKFKDASAFLSVENNTINRQKKGDLKAQLRSYLIKCGILSQNDLGTPKEDIILAKFESAQHWVTVKKTSGFHKSKKHRRSKSCNKSNRSGSPRSRELGKEVQFGEHSITFLEETDEYGLIISKD